MDLSGKRREAGGPVWRLLISFTRMVAIVMEKKYSGKMTAEETAHIGSG